MKKYLFLIFTLLISLVAVSCQDEDFGYKKEDISFHASVKKTFPVISPEQNWTTTKTCTFDCEINTPGSFKIKVFTASPTDAENNSVLLAQFDGPFEGMTGKSFPITIDYPSHLETLYTAIEYTDGQGYIINEISTNTPDKQTSVFGSKSETRSSNGSNTPSFTPSGTQELSARFYTENNFFNNNGNPTGDKHFYFLSTGEKMYLAPIFVGDDLGNIDLGLASHNYEVTIYIHIKSPDDADWGNPIEFCKFDRENQILSVYNNGNEVYRNRRTNYNKYKCAYVGLLSHNHNLEKTICDVMELDIPAGYKYKFSYNTINKNALVNKRISTGDTEQGYWCYLSQQYQSDEKNLRLLGMRNSSNGNTFNDIVFAFISQEPLKVSTEQQTQVAEYTLVYEDLAAKADFDFNDVVVKLTHVQGQTPALVSLQAVGGTLPVYMNSVFKNEELHNVLDVNDTSIPVNVNAVDGEDGKRPITVAYNINTSSTTLEIAKSLTVQVNKPGSEPYNVGWTEENPRVLIISGDKTGFVWPDEGEAIYTKYPDFKAWVESPSSAPTWWVGQ